MYEAGEREPPESTLSRIAEALQFPNSFFQGSESSDVLAERTEGVSFRANYSLRAADRKAALAAGNLAALFAEAIDRRFRLPPCDLPDLSHYSPEAGRGRAQAAAEALRAYWGLGLGPIGNMVRLLEAKGVRVFRLVDEVQEVDAFCFWQDGTPFVLLNTAKSGERSRFDAAHELAHLVLHRDVAEFGRSEEDEANAFASSFLMPEDSARRELPRVPAERHLLAIKPRWGMSTASMVRRGRDLGLYSEWQYKQAFIHLSRTNQRKGEKGALPHEQSLVYERVVRALQRKNLTLAGIASTIGLPKDELWAILPIPAGFENTVELTVNRNKQGSSGGGSATIIPFPFTAS